MKLLYIGDNSPGSDLVRRELDRSAPDITLDLAGSWAEAASLLDRAPANAAGYDLILTGLQLPDGVGIEAVTALRNRTAVPIVVLIGPSGGQAAIDALKAGADDYVVKRGDYLSRLPDLLRGVLDRRAVQAEGLFRPLRVLYVEHNTGDVDLTVRHMTRHAPYIQIERASSASEARQKIAGPAVAAYDVLLLDFALPRQSGPEFLKELRDDLAPHIPVVLVSGHADQEVAIQALKLGASDCIAKSPGYLYRLPWVLESVFHRAQLIREKAALRESEQRFRLLFDSVPVAIVSRDREGRCLSANARASQLWDRSPLGKTLDELLPPELSAAWQAADQRVLDTGAESIVEETVPTPAGPRLFLTRRTPLSDRSGRATGILSISLDISERKSLEAQLLQSQKMEAIGRLAGGVAHDFNNLLTVINGCATLIASEPAAGGVSEVAQQILEAGERAAALTRQLLAFSRRQVMEVTVVNLNSIVAGMERLLERVIGEDISLEASLDPRLRNVLADPIQLEQVIMNFAVNARDAMPRGGALRIATANVTIRDAGSGSDPVPPGEYVRLAVADSGVGMDPATLAHIFEPFFTTKGLDKGTGLGLSTVYGIVKQSGGHIRVGSEPGGGTLFEVFLPAVAREVPRPGRPAPRAAARASASGTVLVVEDEQMVRRLIRSILSREGYTVIDVPDPGAAIQVCQQDPRVIDLMITDVVLPGISGMDLASRVATARPAMRVLYISGYPFEAAGFDRLKDRKPAFLSKPFPPDVLALRVRELLDNGCQDSQGPRPPATA